MNSDDQTEARLLRENADLKIRLEEAEDTLAAIRRGDVDALIVGDDIYTLDSAHTAATRLRKDVLAQMQDAVIAFDHLGHIIFMNPAAERRYGQSASETLGRTRNELFEEQWPSADAEQVSQAALQRDGVHRAQSVHRCRNGERIDVETTVTRLDVAEGQAFGELLVVRDISARIRAERTLQIAVKELARRERQFATIVENSPDIYSRVDPQHRHVYVSPAVEPYAGRSVEHLLGKTLAEWGAGPAVHEQWERALRTAFDGGQKSRMRTRFTDARGLRHVFDARLIPELAENGSVESVLSIATDITEQEMIDTALRDSQARLRFALDFASIGEWDLDLTNDVAVHSLRHDRCFGYAEPIAKWSYEHFLAHIHPDDRGRVAQSFDSSVAAGSEWRVECRVVWPDQTLHWVQAGGSLYVSPDGTRHMMGIIADVTDRRAAEEALREADRRKDDFLATLAHELRNPLAPIRNALQILRLTSDPAKQLKWRDIIERQLQQMVHLVDDLLDVSRISKGKVELRRELVDIADVLRAAVETSRPLIDENKHRLDMRLPEPATMFVNADSTRLCQIVANLLNNSAKYTPEGGSISLTAERNGNNVIICVRDSGVGIRQDLLPRVFDMFTQVERSIERAQGGLGIGLALVKTLVLMHGGSVSAHSDGPGLGSTFIVQLPLSNISTHISASEHEQGPDRRATELMVLVVDDNMDSAHTLAELLQLWGYRTCTAYDGPGAVAAADSNRPAVAVLDIGLPGINGLDVARRIREQPWGRDMVLVALSGWGQGSDRIKTAQAGFDHHFVKPVDIRRLAKVLEESRSDP
ncbi:PAS domain S-box-containing protein [Panacagrimonas perspica]|uniref:histidine kinase n=1 Tax=Panacagrimonas perspica TaxID=381431 RepID=A0A4R7PEW2_9GAMM|nr:PAS domain S-box protein [Panacagrimonas perspica]TDU32708.1 PAS domain S-box-containing protein [Panacagrimonas perspica]THD05590.1 hypothetical protein B1810_02415 [Panacagrimonas perspica]